MRICVVGDGLAALASAYYASRSAARVVVAPVSRTDRYFSSEGQRFSCFHRPIHADDVALCGLLSDLGLLQRVRWRDAKLSIFAADQGRFLEPSFRLGLDCLPLVYRLRALPGLARLFGYAPLSTQVLAGDWMARNCGARAFRSVAYPLLSSAFGEGVHRLSARGLQVLVRELMNHAASRQAVFPGGYGNLLNSTRTRLSNLGVRFRKRGSIAGIEPDCGGASARVWFGQKSEVFDAVVTAGPASEWIKLVNAPEDVSLPALDASPSGMISTVVVLRGAPVLPMTVLPFTERGYPFSWVHVVPPDRPRTGTERHAVYLTHRGPAHLPAFLEPDESWAQRARGVLEQLAGPSIEHAIQDVRVFRTLDVDPLPVNPALGEEMPERLESLPVFLSSTARRSTPTYGPEGAVLAAREAVVALAHPSFPSRAPEREARRSASEHHSVDRLPLQWGVAASAEV